ncbi:MAG: hypothetical protein WBB07_15705 [Mycobacterium sp.]
MEDTQTYVRAAASRGYHHPDLTMHGAQVRDWYGTEDGLDLRALDADSAALRAAGSSAGEALALLQTLRTALGAAWSGESGRVAGDFLDRQVQQARQVVDALDTAAACCERLRDELWRAVETKVVAAVDIDGRAAPRRAPWLAAAREVLVGHASGDAGSLVDSEIMPFVATAIGGDWVAAMRAAETAVDDAYRGAVGAVATRSPARFDVPGDLGPRAVAPAAVSMAPVLPGSVSMAPVAADPVSMAPVGRGVPAATVLPPTGEPAPPPPSSMVDPAVAQPDSMGALPTGMPLAGMPELGSALTAAPTRLAESLGGLLGSGSAAPEGFPGAANLEPLVPPELGSPHSARDSTVPGDVSAAEKEAADEEADEEASDRESGEEAADEEADEAVADEEAEEQDELDGPDSQDAELTDPGGDPASTEAAAPTELDHPEDGPALPVAADPARTPCEIAADELPQVGE